MLTKLGRKVEEAWIDGASPWSNVYGVARSLLAFAGAVTLTCSPVTAVFRPGTGLPHYPICGGPRDAGLFCIVSERGGSLELARWIAVGCLLLTASGWRPRITGVIHAWVSWSFAANALLLEGGDQVQSVLAAILLPVTLGDSRRWHWSAPVAAARTPLDDAARIVAHVALVVARLQVAAIYFQAFVGKLAVPEWTDGTALWYWLLHPDLGAVPWLAVPLRALLATPLVAPLTWGVLVAEAALTFGLLASKPQRRALLVLGAALHAGIFVVHGLMTFMFAMFGALVLYLRPLDEPFRLGRAAARIRSALSVSRVESRIPMTARRENV